MTARIILMVAVLLTALLVSTVVLPAAAIAGVRPDLVTLTVVGFALADGPDTGLRYGFTAGLASDLLSGGEQPVGVTALVLLLIGYVVGLIRPYLTVAPTVGMIVVGGTAAAMAVLATSFLSALLDVGPVSPGGLLRTAVGTGLYSAAIAPFVGHLARALSQRFSASATGV